MQVIITFTIKENSIECKKISFMAYSSGYGADFDEDFPENVENDE